MQLPVENVIDVEKAINEQVRRLKKTKLEQRMASAETAEEIQQLVEEKRKLESLYITI